MEEYFCTTHGSKLQKGFVCLECQEEKDKNNWRFVPEKERVIDYLNDRIDRSKPFKDCAWARTNPKSHPYCYFCHNCKYVMFHGTRWCHKCGGEFDNQSGNLTYAEITEKYPDYKQGY